MDVFTNHRGHRLVAFESKDSAGFLLACIKCGSFMSSQAKNLAKTCVGKPPNMAAATCVRRLGKLQHPKDKSPLSAPVPILQEGGVQV